MDIQEFCLTDIFAFHRVNIDPFTETFTTSFYSHYGMGYDGLAWTVRNNSGQIVGYILGCEQTEGKAERTPNAVQFTHITAVTVSQESRRLGIARTLMYLFERNSVRRKVVYIDLYVRASNAVAIQFYRRLGYMEFRRVIGYYETLDEDGFQYRKVLIDDPGGKWSTPQPACAKDEVDD